MFRLTKVLVPLIAKPVLKRTIQAQDSNVLLLVHGNRLYSDGKQLYNIFSSPFHMVYIYFHFCLLLFKGLGD